MHLRLYGMNANGKVYEVDTGCGLDQVSRLILAVDTTHEFGSLALLRAARNLIDEMCRCTLPMASRKYSIGHLADLLGRHGLKPGDIDCFAAASGPGSFTGVRVGLACVKGLAEALGSPPSRCRTYRRLRRLAPLRCAPWCWMRVAAKCTARCTMPHRAWCRPK